MAEEAPAEVPPPEGDQKHDLDHCYHLNTLWPISGEEGAEATATVELPPACMDLQDFLPKIDFFDNMQLLDEKAEKIEGANNFRQVAAFPVFGTGQTTEEGFMKVLEKVKSVHGEEGEKIIWFNMRKVMIFMSLISE